MTAWDCVVIGSGHAGSCAALSASQSGCKRVLVVDKCPVQWAGGNGYFTAGAHRTVHAGLDDILPLVSNVSKETAEKIDMEPYTAEEFTNDIMRLGGGRSDPAIVKAVVDNSRQAIGWLASDVEVPFTMSFNRQAYEVDGRQKFWGGMVLSVQDGGKGLIAAHQKALQKAGIEMWFDAPAVDLLMKDNVITGVVVEKEGQSVTLEAKAVVLAAGGFEANPDLRVWHLGPEWRQARVRGTPYNNGDGFNLSRRIGAKFTGDWEGCHSTAWDANAAADTGDRELSNQFTKSGYPLGIMVNSQGNRFVDEGEDFRNYTYAKFGKEILKQPGGFAFQTFDKKVLGWLREEEYDDSIVEKIVAGTVDELAEKLSGKGLEDTANFLKTMSDFNEAVRRREVDQPEAKWDPAIKDGLSTQKTLPLAKSNWALTIDEAPFVAVKVCTGITFTFGGLAIDPDTAGVLSEESGERIQGLYCTGEMVGGIFYGNYPGGSGLTAGAVFGRKAGFEAGKQVNNCIP